MMQLHDESWAAPESGGAVQSGAGRKQLMSVWLACLEGLVWCLN